MSDPGKPPTDPNFDRSLTRRSFLRYGGSVGAAVAGMSGGGALERPRRSGRDAYARPTACPTRKLPAGTVNEALPFDHIVVVMMENHSFDNLLGALRRSGQPKARRPAVRRQGRGAQQQPRARRPGARRSRSPPPRRAPTVTQTLERAPTSRSTAAGWTASCARSTPISRWATGPRTCCRSPTRSRARFTLANRWFCSAPCQTYPNRRFLMAGTAYGDIATDTESLKDPPPPNGTIFDRLHAYGISWRNYFTDLPQTAIIPSIIEKYPTNLAPIAQFFADCATGDAALRELRRPRVRRALRHRRAAGDRARHRSARREARNDRRRRGEPAEHGLRRVLGLPDRQRRAALARLAAHAADLHLRRARRLLRPRPAARPRSRPTRSRRNWRPKTSPAATTSTARASRRSSPPPTPSPTPSPTSCTTTPPCSRRSRRSGTCRPSPTATPTRKTVADFLDRRPAGVAGTADDRRTARPVEARAR